MASRVLVVPLTRRWLARVPHILSNSMTTLSNSAFTTFQTCPTKYQLRFQEGLSSPDTSYFQFGHRFHQLLQAHHGGGVASPPPSDLPAVLEAEAQAMFEAYCATYPVEPFKVIEVERRFEIPIGSHTYIGRIDATIRNRETKRLQLLEHKTESRGSKRNLPEAWAARTQVSLYAWAAGQIYGERVDSILLNVATRGTEKGRIGPSFRRDILERTPAQVDQAISDFYYVAKQIEELSRYMHIPQVRELSWPRNTNACVDERGFKCDYYQLCHYGRSEGTLSRFVKVDPFGYLTL